MTALTVSREGPIAHLVLADSAGGNAIDGALLHALASACEELRFQDSVQAVVLRAEGPVFCQGWDWEALLGPAEGAGEATAALEALGRYGLPGDVFGCLAALPQPVVCAVTGDAIGAGFEVALACDLRVAAQGARFAFPEAEFGLLPLAGGAQRLARLAGRARALEALLSGRPLEAGELAEWGVVNAVVPREEVLARATSLAQRIAERGPLAVRYAKEAVSRGPEMPLEQALRFETDLTIILQTTQDRAEGVRAFLEKRLPRFQGR